MTAKPDKPKALSSPKGADNPFRLLPSVDEALRLLETGLGSDAASASTPEKPIPRSVLAELVQDELEAFRQRIGQGKLDAASVQADLDGGAFQGRLRDACRIERGRGVVPAVNATGVVLHTNLGRAPVHPEVAERMKAAAMGYCVLELDRYSARRNERDARLGVLLARATGAETGIAVNNCAAAAFLMMQTYAGGREAIVSRGELVEIGGSFRVPDVMERAGVKLVEVGSTNRTRIADYERAITENTSLMMKVHTSNFRVVGFTEEVDPEEMARLGRERGITTGWDLGSGRFEAEGARSLDVVGDETVLRDAVASGVDAIAFSGDKLLGGPQAGLIVGRRAAIRELRANPIYRAMRLDKVSLSGLEATLELLAAGRGDELPSRRLMHLTVDELAPVAARIAEAISRQEGFEAEVIDSESQPGSGSAPTVFLPTKAVRVRWAGHAADHLANRLRAGQPPVFVRIQDGAVHLDPRALLDGDEARLLEAFAGLIR
ncbi:MAG: L-seryl-tRNA(Ser) seleniumtransferase [Planctomycetota bacterium]|jgi:L-seryl-tRNA(Ser) seleniumtransferase